MIKTYDKNEAHGNMAYYLLNRKISLSFTCFLWRQILEKDFTHFDSQGNAVMVDVSAKETTIRSAEARGSITMNDDAMKAVLGGTVKKGDVLSVARIAGIMAAKRCSDLIPLCHALSLDECTIDFTIHECGDKKTTSEEPAKGNMIEVKCKVKLSGKTGAEMEALSAVSIALLTIYDMCKAIDRAMVIGDIRLWEKSGGKSGHFKLKKNR